MAGSDGRPTEVDVMTAGPGQNIEVKARYPDLDRAREICRQLNARFEGVLNQIDTYFQTNAGRLKLRQIRSGEAAVASSNADDAGVAPTTEERAELISYNRPNNASIRSSHYTIEPVIHPAARLAELSRTHRRTCIIRKRRELYLWHNVRIHLDDVEQLGAFIEFEGVVGPDADEQLSRQRVDRLVNEFAIAPADQVGGSYSDLLMAR